MIRLIFLAVFLSAPAYADMRHKITTSAQLTVDAAYTSTNRAPSSYSLSGNNITPSVTADGSTTSGKIGGLNLGSLTAGVPALVHTDKAVTTAGSSFSLTETYQAGDSTPSAPTVSAGVVGSLPILSGTTITGSGGVAGNLAATSLSSGVVTVVAGGAGTTGIAQTIVETVTD